MSNFHCEYCGAASCDTGRGYVQGCRHYPPDAVTGKLWCACGAEFNARDAGGAYLREQGECPTCAGLTEMTSIAQESGGYDE